MDRKKWRRLGLEVIVIPHSRTPETARQDQMASTVAQKPSWASRGTDFV